MTTATDDKSVRTEARRRVEDREIEIIEQERAEAAETERTEQVRVSTLAEANEEASRVLSERASTLPDYVAARTRMIELGVQIQDQHKRYVRVVTRAARNGGSLETSWPRIEKIDRREQELLRNGIALSDQV